MNVFLKKNTCTVFRQNGFTLMEVLVAMVITGMAVAVFFQIISSSIRLEYNSIQRTSEAVKVSQAFGKAMALDVRKNDFNWQGEHEEDSWSLRIEPVDTQKTRSYIEENHLRLSSELYKYVFKYRTHEGREWILVRYVQHEKGFFDEDFQMRHFH